MSLFFLLTACGGSDEDSDSSGESSFTLPGEIQAAKLEITNISATLSVDGGVPQDMTVTDTGATITLNLPVGTHTFAIVFYYDDDTYGLVSLARATISADITATNSSITFVDSDYTYDDDDGDGYTNLYELDNDLDPTVNEPPVVTATIPSNGAIDVAANTLITATFNDPMDATTLTTTSFTLTGTVAGSVSGTVTYDTVSQTASFIPTNGLDPYETYTATLTTAVKDEGGAGLAADFSWSFTIQEPPVLQVSDIRTAATYTTPTIVYNDAGDGVAVWEVSSAGRAIIYSMYDAATGSWSADTILTSVSDTNSLYPKLVSNGTGFAVVWQQYSGSVYELFASTYDGTVWSTPVIIDAGTTSVSSNSHKLASNGTGYGVAWTQNFEGNDRIYGSISTNGATWGNAVILDTSSSTASYPEIASNGSGYAVIWTEGSPSQLGVILYTGISWGTAKLLDDVANSIYNHRIASNGSGYSVIWMKYDGVEFDYDLFNRTYYDIGGVFSWSAMQEIDNGINSVIGPEIVSNGTGYAVTYGQYDPIIYRYDLFAKVNATGDDSWGASTPLDGVDDYFWGGQRMASDGVGYAVAWRQSDVTYTSSAYASIYEAGRWVVVAMPLETASTDVSTVELAGFNAQYVATWHQEVNGVNSIFANVYTSVSNWGNVELLEFGDGEVSDPKVSVSPIGGITVAWNQENSSGTDTASYFNVYDEGWSGAQTLVAATYPGSSYDPQLLANDSGKIMAIWTQDRNGETALYANFHENGAWGVPELLSDSATKWTMASDGTGFAVVWRAYDGNYQSIFARVHNGISWGSATEVDDTTLNGDANINTSYKQRSLVSNGNGYMLVFEQYDDSLYAEIAYAHQFNGTEWETPETLVMLYGDIYSYLLTPYVHANGTTYMAAWIVGGRYDSTIYTKEFNNGSWGSSFVITSAMLTGTPILASGGSSYLAVWGEYNWDTTTYRILGNFYVNGSWGITPVELGIGSGGIDSSSPFAISDGSGYAVAWHESDWDNSVASVKVNIHDGTTWTGMITLDSGVLNDILFDTTDLLVTAGDQYAVLWGYDDNADDVHNLYVSVYDPVGWSAKTALETGAGNVTNFQFTSNGVGFLAAWRQDNGSGIYDIVSNRYELGRWEGASILDEGTSSAFDLDLSGDLDGYYTIWTQPEPGGDEAVRFPWAKVGF